MISDRTDVLKILPEAAAELSSALFRNSPAGIYITRDGKFIYTNIEFRRITGYSQNELSGKDYQRLINPRYRQQPKQNIASLFEEDESSSHEFKITTKDGKKKWISERITYFKYGSNWLTLGHWLDISEHHSVQKAWREAERRFQAAFEDLTTGLAIIGIDGIFLKVNKAFCDMLSYEEKDLLESRFDQIIDADERESQGDIMALFLSLEKPEQPAERRLRTRDGRSVWSAMSISLIGDSEGGPTYFIVHFQDITEQKRIEEGIKEEGRLYRSLVDVSLEPVAVIDLAGNISHVSGKFISFLGYPDASDLIGRNIAALATQEEHESVLPRIIDIIRNGVPAAFPVTLVRKDSSVLQVEMNVSWISSDKGAPVSVVLSPRTMQQEPAAESLLSVAFENTTTAIMLVERDTKIAAVNRAFEIMSGYTKEEVEGKKSWIEFVAPEDQAKVKRHYLVRQLDPESALDIYDFKFADRTGNTRDVLVNIAPVPDTDRLTATLVEIAAYRESLLAVAQAEKTTEAATETAEMAYLDVLPEPVIVTDTEGTITYASSGTIKLLAYGISADIIGKHYVKFIRPGLIEDVKEIFNILLDTGGIKTVESEMVCTDGKLIPVELNAAIYRDKCGETAGAVFLFRDITSLKETEQTKEEIEKSYRLLAERVSEMEHRLARQDRMMEGSIQTLAAIIDLRDPFTSGHQERVARIAGAIARQMNLSEDTVKCVETAGRIHDIGKIYVPMEILSKRGTLSSIERQLIQTHARGSYDMLKPIDFPWPIAEIALQHHERINGSGYPQGLKDNDISLEARILMVADVVEAMASYRPYRSEHGIGVALKEISGNSGILYDANVVAACLTIFIDKGFKLEDQS